MKKFSLCYLALTVGASGAAIMGCMPNNFETAHYNAANYTPSTDGNGLAGTWLLTTNNEIVAPDIPFGVYRRELVRLKAIDGTPDSYEVTYCDDTPAVVHVTTTFSGNTIALPGNNGGNYSPTTNGRLLSIAPFADGTIVQHAVRLSGNPDFDAGTVGLAFASDGAAITRQPTVCFGEYLLDVPAIDDIRPSSHVFRAVGASASGVNTARLGEEPIGTTTSLRGSDDTGRQFEGPIVDNINTSESTVKGVSGTVVTQGSEDPSTGGSLVLDIKL